MRRVTKGERNQKIITTGYDRVSTEELLKETNLPSLEQIMNKRRIKWASELTRNEDWKAHENFKEEKMQKGEWYEKLKEAMNYYGIDNEEEFLQKDKSEIEEFFEMEDARIALER